jgi:putative aldouronate transport system permease protein
MKRKKFEALDIISFIMLTLLLIIVILPFYSAFVTSLTSSASYARSPVQLFPYEFSLDSYRYVFENSALVSGYLNTIFITAIGVALSMAVSLMTAYGLSYKDYPGKKLMFILVLIPMYFTGGLLPTYLLMKNLDMVGKLWGIILLCGITPFNIIIIKNGIDQLPDELSEAARMDGAGEIYIFARVLVPLLAPVIATFSLFYAVDYWNEWFWSMLLLTKPETKTLQIILRTIVASSQDAASGSVAAAYDNVAFSQGIKMAAVVVAMLPIMLVYPFLQKYFAKGMLVGAVKM